MERQKDTDAVAGLMVVWIILAHLQMICHTHLEIPRLFFYSMPWFYYKAGMMWKKKDFRTALTNGVHKFFPPWLGYGLCGLFVLTICLIIEHDFSFISYLKGIAASLLLDGCIKGNGPLWFITSLFFVQCISALFLSKRDYSWLIAIVSILLGGLLHYSGISTQYIPIYIKSLFGGLFFFQMGYWCRERQYHRWVGISAVVFLSIFYLFSFIKDKELPCFVILANDVELGYYFVNAIISVICCIAINNLFRWLQPLLRFEVLQYVGRQAMSFYALHWIVLMLSVQLAAMDLLHIQNPVYLLWIGGISCILLPIYTILRKQVKKRA